MSARDLVTFGDLERAARERDPQLGELLVRYLARDDADPGVPEDALDGALADGADPDDPAGAAARPSPPPGAMTIHRLRQSVNEQVLRGKSATERKLARREAWQAAMASPWMPPRVRLGALLVELYEAGDEPARSALVNVFGEGKLGWGVWQAAKTIYKRAEERHDALLFGVLAHRFDVMHDTGEYWKTEISPGTVLYLKRRAWRWLRHLGQAVPDAYPTFAVEVLRHYGRRERFQSSWVASEIWGRKRMRGAKRPVAFDPAPLTERAFPDAWKVSPAPLVRLLLEGNNPLVCQWAVTSLEAEHVAALHALPPDVLARLGRRTLAPVQELVVKLLRARADLHPSRYRAAGLHEVVLGFLRSPSPVVATFAVEYARAHAPDLAVAELVELVNVGQKDVGAFAVDRLAAMSPTAIGLPALIRLVAFGPSRAMAIAKLKEGARPADLTAELFVALAIGVTEQRSFVGEWYAAAGVAVPAGHWIAALADQRCDWQVRRKALEELGKRSGTEIGAAWIQKALDDPQLTAAVAAWLEGGKLAGAALDVTWVKGLVSRPRLRPMALRLLGNRNLVAPSAIGLAWLLELARSTEPDLHSFAHRLLLEHFTVEDFAADAGAGTRAGGLARLWELATGPKSQEQVRAFASTYLRAHHPGLGPQLAEAKAVGLAPRLTHDDYPMPRVVPLVDDPRADVRRLACAIVGEEVVRWGDRALPYRLAASGFREPRVLGVELLVGATEPGGAGDPTLPADWLDGARLFALAESPHKASREAALTIIRRAYDRVGGRERLAWLMESAERDVRLFAVRLFWDRHRGEAVGDDAATAALRQFLRTVVFGLPPGRLEKRDPIAGAKPERPLSSSVAKRRLVETVAGLAIEDAGFASVVTPVLGELAASAARGEWNAAVSALAAIRRAHPGLGTLGLPAPRDRPAHAAVPAPARSGVVDRRRP